MPDGGTRPLPGWPRALGEQLAAAYVGLSGTTFRQVVMPLVPAVLLSAGRKAWLREDLDAWLEARPRTRPVDGSPAHADASAAPETPAPHARDPIAAALAALPPQRRARGQGAPR